MTDRIKTSLPEFCYKRKPIQPVGVVIHYISARNILPKDPFNLDAIISIFKKYHVSAHGLIRRDGTFIELVPKEFIAYHAGYSRMNGRDWCNNFTFGYELEGGSDWDFTDEQIIVLADELAKDMTEHQFTLEWIQGHDRVRYDWNEAHPEKQASKKYDPGEHFPWKILNDMLEGVSISITNNK